MEKKIRNSSFELLRILLIFMILVEHVNMWFIGSQCADEMEHAVRCMVQSMCLPAVNAFVLISGWFGIKGDYKRIYPLMFQMAVCIVPTFVVCLAVGLISLKKSEDLVIYLLGGANYWFVIDYIALSLFAPLLNTIAKHVDRKTLKMSLIATYTLIIFLDVFLRTHILGIEGGYSALWFIWLYLFAMYVRLYGWQFVEKNKCFLMGISIVLEAFLFYFGLQGTRYTNPLVLMPAICLIMVFKNWSFKNRMINNIAPATLMVYMLHMQPCFVPFFRMYLGDIYNSEGYYIYMIYMLGVIVLFYITSFFVYRTQLLLWKFLSFLCLT